MYYDWSMTESHPKPGPKPLAAGEQRSVVAQVRVKPREMDAMRALAGEQGVSAWLYGLVRRAMRMAK